MEKFRCDHDMHTHTVLSTGCNDERQTPANILAHAEANGYSLQCITDHLWDSAVAGASAWYAPQTIAHAQGNLPLPRSERVRLLFGCETEFCGGDKLGLRPDHFAAFDFVVIPPTHFHMAGFVRPADIASPEQLAALLVTRLQEIAALPLPFYKVGIAHLTTPLLRRGESKYEVLACVDEQRFFDAVQTLARKGAGIELNGACFSPAWREQEELELKLYRIARAAGCKFYLGSDAHALERLDVITTVLPPVVEALGLTQDDRFYLPDK